MPTTKVSDSFLSNINSTASSPLRFEEWEQAAKQKMTSEAFGYVQSGAGGEETLNKNITSFPDYSLIPRFLNDVSELDTRIDLFGKTYPHPFLLAPVGMLKLAHKDADIAVAKAAARYGIPFIQSTVSSYSIEDVASSTNNSPKWFQLYWSVREEISYSMVERAERSGYEAIVLTVDTTMLGWREQDLQNQFSPLKQGVGKANYETDEVFLSLLERHDDETIIQEILTNIYHPTLNWKHIAELKKHTTLPILLKGILHPEDAKLAIENGVDGMIVSNHGGRQLDGIISSIDALPAVTKAVNGEIPVLLDSGIRRGSDVVKALALGADSVLIGRPYVYGLAADGQTGVEKVLSNIIEETRVSLSLSGAATIDEAKNITIQKG